jgi:hypothetical protein
MRLLLGTVLAVVLTTHLALAMQHCSKADVDRSTGFCTVPDPALTPGEMDASLACVSNVDRPRHVTEAEKNAILAAYGLPARTDKSSGEFDHWLPHWMGDRTHRGTSGSSRTRATLVRSQKTKLNSCSIEKYA